MIVVSYSRMKYNKNQECFLSHQCMLGEFGEKILYYPNILKTNYNVIR